MKRQWIAVRDWFKTGHEINVRDRAERKGLKQAMKVVRTEPAYYNGDGLERELLNVIDVLSQDRVRLNKALEDANGTVPAYCTNAVKHTRWAFYGPGDVVRKLEQNEAMLEHAGALFDFIASHPDFRVLPELAGQAAA